MDNTAFLVQVADAMGDLEDNMTRQLLAEVCQLDAAGELVSTQQPSGHYQSYIWWKSSPPSMTGLMVDVSTS